MLGWTEEVVMGEDERKRLRMKYPASERKPCHGDNNIFQYSFYSTEKLGAPLAALKELKVLAAQPSGTGVAVQNQTFEPV